MATYTTEEAANTYLGTNDVSENEILQAERDLDDLALGAHGDRQTVEPYRKLDPSALTDFKADGLARACAEQVRYRRLMGEEFFIRPQRQSGSADGVSYEGTLPHIAPRVLAILSDVGLSNRLGGGTGKNASQINLEDIGWSEV